MKRRSFIHKTSAGFGALLIAPNVWSCQYTAEEKKHFKFRPYREGGTLTPVTCITPDDGFYLHTFYDVCPFSPSQRYLAVTKFPYQGKPQRWGDIAEVCVIDLEEQTIHTVYKTKGWAFQLGANIQWGEASSDRYLYCNDVIDEKPVCVRIDLKTLETRAYNGSKYDISPDEKYIVSSNLMAMNIHQYGYAVADNIYNKPNTLKQADMPYEGLWRTDLDTNETTLLAGMSEFSGVACEKDQKLYEESIMYLFHSKINKKNNRIMQVVRAQQNDEGRNASLFTLKPDGSDIIQCLSIEEWNQKGRLGGAGNHPNWHPDGEHIIMNCIPRWLGYEDMLFCQFKYDGSDFKIVSEKHIGAGHPSVNKDGTFLVADIYMKQNNWFDWAPEGEIPIRLLNLKTDEHMMICSIRNDVGNNNKIQKKGEPGSHYKLDPHPAWSRDYKKICFNGAPEGRRQVYVADLSEIV
jgi:hypothetical protein